MRARAFKREMVDFLNGSLHIIWTMDLRPRHLVLPMLLLQAYSATPLQGAGENAAPQTTAPAAVAAVPTVVAIERISIEQVGRRVQLEGEVEKMIHPLSKQGKYVLLLKDGTGIIRLSVPMNVWEKITFRDKIVQFVHLRVRPEITELDMSHEEGKVVEATLLAPEDMILDFERPKAPGDDQEAGRWPWVAGVSLVAAGGVGGLYLWRRRQFGEISQQQEAERERAQKALKEGMARVEHLLRSGPSVIYSMAVPGEDEFAGYSLNFVSENVEQILGYRPDDCLANSGWWLENVHPEDRSIVLSASSEAITRAGSFEREYRFRHRNGNYLWISDRQTLLRNAEGVANEVLGTWSDVTDRARSDRMKMIFASLGQRLSAITTKEEAARVALRVADELFGWDASYVSLYSPSEDRLRGVVSYDLVKGKRREVARYVDGVPVTELTREILERGARLILRNEADLEEANGLKAFGEKKRSASLLFAPIRKAGKGIGIFSIQSYTCNAYRNEDLVLLQLLADYCGAALERTTAQEQRKEMEERYALALRGANDGLWDWDLRQNRVYYSPRLKAMIGCDDAEISDSPNEWISRIHPNDLERVKGDVEAHVRGETEQLETQYRMHHKDGNYRWMLMRGVAVRDEKKDAYRMAGSLTDVTLRRKAEEQLMHGAYYDALTGLPNRLLFTEQLRRAVARCKRHQDQLFAVLFIDLDRFKIINDSLGHLVGDQLLVNVAGRLKSCVRPEDMVARLGGDEFTILLEDIAEPSHATRVAERIQEELVKPVNLSGHDVYSTASIGIALSSTGYQKAEDILRDADAAMYRAKAKGKARHELFDSAMHERALQVLQLEADLRRGLERSEFKLVYQPFVSVQTGRITGFEALLRWEHPQRGTVSPAEFIPLAEENGLIVPLGWWVLREACRQVREWQQSSPGSRDLTISVNVSRKQFSQPDLVSGIEAILEETGLDARYLALEITESVLMEKADSLDTLLASLKSLGLQLHIDDFGTGYSSLSYLHRFPIDTLKIDRSFVSRMTPDGANVEIVKAIVTLAGSLNIGVVAEGVETADQAEVLRELACNFVQGYFFYRPVPPETICEVLAGQLVSATAE